MAVGYYDQEFEPWARGIRSIGSAIVQAPMLRAAAQQRQQQAQLTQAQIGTEGAQRDQYASGARKNDAETQMLIKKGQLVTALEQSAAQAQQDIADGNTNTEAVRTFAGAASALTGANGDDIVASARQGIGTILGRMGKVTEAASVEDPVEIEKARISAKRGMVVQPGGAVFDPNSGQPVFTNPSAAAQREGEYETTTVDVQATEGDPGEPATPAVKRSFMGIDALRKDTPASPGRPAIPGQPAKKITTRRKLGDVAAAPWANQEQDPNDSEMPEDVTPEPAAARAGKPLDAATAKALLQEVGGDKQKARELAKQRGYTF